MFWQTYKKLEGSGRVKIVSCWIFVVEKNLQNFCFFSKIFWWHFYNKSFYLKCNLSLYIIFKPFSIIKTESEKKRRKTSQKCVGDKIVMHNFRCDRDIEKVWHRSACCCDESEPCAACYNAIYTHQSPPIVLGCNWIFCDSKQMMSLTQTAVVVAIRWTNERLKHSRIFWNLRIIIVC